MLDEQGITKGEYDGIKVSYTTNTKSELDDDTLIQILLNMAQEKPRDNGLSSANIYYR